MIDSICPPSVGVSAQQLSENQRPFCPAPNDSLESPRMERDTQTDFEVKVVSLTCISRSGNFPLFVL